MDRNRFIKFKKLGTFLRWGVITLALFTVFSCAYPGIRESAIQPDDVLDFVDRNYDDFTITYCGGMAVPTAIRFDPRNDDAALTGDGWHAVESKAQVDGMIRQMIARYRFYNGVFSGPYLFEIQSKEGKVIGYYYSIHDNLTVRRDGDHYRLSPVTELDLRDARKYYTIKGAGY